MARLIVLKLSTNNSDTIIILTKFLSDGIMGRKTRNALMNFQKDNNIPDSGRLDEKTLQKLNSLSNK